MFRFFAKLWAARMNETTSPVRFGIEIEITPQSIHPSGQPGLYHDIKDLADADASNAVLRVMRQRLAACNIEAKGAVRLKAK